MSDTLVEAVARGVFNAMCEEAGRSVTWDDRPGWPGERDREHGRIGARAALAAIEAQGWCVVPKEPTSEMLDAAYARDTADGRWPVTPDSVYAAMLEARPKVWTE